jgi:hypothetical protein
MPVMLFMKFRCTGPRHQQLYDRRYGGTSAYIYWDGETRVDIAAPLVAGVFAGSLLGARSLRKYAQSISCCCWSRLPVGWHQMI